MAARCILPAVISGPKDTNVARDLGLCVIPFKGDRLLVYSDKNGLYISASLKNGRYAAYMIFISMRMSLCLETPRVSRFAVG